MPESTIEIDIFSTGTGDSARREKNKALANRLTTMVEAARKVTEQWTERWNRSLDYAYDNQLADKKREEGWQPVQINQVWPVIKQEMAVLAQRRHRMVPRAWRASDEEEVRKAEFWKGHLQWRYDKTMRMRPFLWRALLDAKLNGWMIAKLTEDDKAWWDEDQKKWVYQPKISLVESKNFGIDPNAETDEDAQYMCHKYRVTLSEAIERWGYRNGRRDSERIALLERLVFESETLDDITQVPVIDQQQMMTGDRERDRGVTKSRGGELVQLLRNARNEAMRTLEPASDSPVEKGERYLTVTEIYFRDNSTKKVKEYEDYFKEELLEQGAIAPIYAEQGPAEPQVDPNTGAPMLDPVTGEPVMQPQPEPVVVGFKVANPEHPAWESLGREVKAGEPINSIDWPQKKVGEYEEPKFPYGRVVFMVNDTILNDREEEQRWHRRKWPFEIGYNLLLPHCPQGMDSVGLLVGTQDLINYTWAHIANWLAAFSDPRTIIEEDALPANMKLKAKAMRILTVVKGALNKTRREPGVDLGGGLVNVFQMLVRQLQDLGGQHDPTLGGMNRSTSQTATAITVAQQATQVGMGLQILLLDDFVLRIMEQVADMDRRNIASGDQVRIVADVDKDSVADWTDEMKDLEFDLDLQVGVALPYDQERNKIDAIALRREFPNNPKAKENMLEAYEQANRKEWMDADAEYQEFLAWKEMMMQQVKVTAEAQGAGGESAAAPAAVAAPPMG